MQQESLMKRHMILVQFFLNYVKIPLPSEPLRF